jgi:hypothetical protein
MTKSWEQFTLETGLLACMLADIENISFASVVEVSAYVDIYIRLDRMLFLSRSTTQSRSHFLYFSRPGHFYMTKQQDDILALCNPCEP